MARGSIHRRGDSWTGLVDLPPDPATGKRRQKRVTARTRKEVEQTVAALLAATESGFTDAKNLTVSAYFAQWFEAIAPTIKPSTLRRYQDLIRLHALPIIGGQKLAKLTPGDSSDSMRTAWRSCLQPPCIIFITSCTRHLMMRSNGD